MSLSVVVYLATRYGLELHYVPDLSQSARRFILRLLTFITATSVRGFNLFHYSTQSGETIILIATPVIDVYSRRRTIYIYGYVLSSSIVSEVRDTILIALLRTYMSYYKLARLDRIQLRKLLENAITEFRSILLSLNVKSYSINSVREIIKSIHDNLPVRVLVTTCSHAMTIAGQVLRALRGESLREFSLAIIHKTVPVPSDVKLAIQYPSDGFTVEVRGKTQAKILTQQQSQITEPDIVREILMKVVKTGDPREIISQIVDQCMRVSESVCRDVRKDFDKYFLNAIKKLFKLYRQTRNVILRQKIILELLNLAEKLLLSKTGICLSERSLKVFMRVLSRLYIEEVKRRLCT